MGSHVGYIRVSSGGQNTERQLEGIKIDKYFTETVSAKDTNRPKLKELLDYVREGDCVHVHSMDRLARNLDDLRKLVRTLTNQGVEVRFEKENLRFNNNDAPMSQLMLSVMGAFAEFERSLIRERQREGIALAKKRGAYKGRKKMLNNEQVQELKRRVENKEPKASIARSLGISRYTLYQYLS